MNVGRFTNLLILIGMEVEPIGSKAVHDWHGHLADGGERASMPVSPYAAVNP